MNGRKAKALRKLAAQIAAVNPTLNELVVIGHTQRKIRRKDVEGFNEPQFLVTGTQTYVEGCERYIYKRLKRNK